MGFNTVIGSGGSDKVNTAVLNQIHVDGVFVKTTPMGTAPNVVYRVGDGTVHAEGWDNVLGNEYLDFYISFTSDAVFAGISLVGTNILDVIKVADDLVKGIGTNQSTDSAILNALTNANQTIADAASTAADVLSTNSDVVSSGANATNAQLSEWVAEAERLTADSYATEAEDTFVNLVTSDGDGTFTYTPTTDYSSLHHAAKAATFNPAIYAPIASPAFTGTVQIENANVSAYGKNYIINGGFDYWNYATTQTTNGYGSDDRWNNESIGSTKVHSQVACTDTERALFNASKFSRTVVTSVAGTSNYVLKSQAVENITKLAGKIVTVSFWAKADSNKSIGISIKQRFGSGGSPSSTIHSIGLQLIALTSTWQKKTITITLPSIVGKTLGTDGVHTSDIRLCFWFEGGSSTIDSYIVGQQSGTFDIAEVKLEEGSVATPWTPYEGEFGGEIQACRRYYQNKFVGRGVSNGYASGAASLRIPLIVQMRIPPTVGQFGSSYTNAFERIGTGPFTPTGSVSFASRLTNAIQVDVNDSGITTSSIVTLNADVVYASAEL